MSESSGFDINSLLPSSNKAVQKAPGGRPYTELVTKGKSKLLINLAIEPTAYKKGGALFLVLRGMETPATMSEAAAAFQAWGWRDLGDQLGTRTYKRQFPMLTLPCHPAEVVGAWKSLDMSTMLKQEVSKLLTQDGVSTDVSSTLDIMLEALIEPFMEVKPASVLDGKVNVITE